MLQLKRKGDTTTAELISLKQQSIEKYFISGYKSDEPIYSLPVSFIPKHPKYLTIPNILSAANNQYKYGNYNFKTGNNEYLSDTCSNSLTVSPLQFETPACNNVRVGVSVIRFENNINSPSLFAVAGSNGVIRIFDIYDCFCTIQGQSR